MSNRTSQHGLFDPLSVREAREQSADRKARWEKYLETFEARKDPFQTKLGIVRGFLSITCKQDPAEVLELRLESLGARSLHQLIETHWCLVCAWMKEVQMYPNERYHYLRETPCQNSK